MALVRRWQHTSAGIAAGREAEARARYGGAPGLPVQPRPVGVQDNPVLRFDAGDDEHEIHPLATPQHVAPAGNHRCLEVADLGALHDRRWQRGTPIDDVQTIDGRPRVVMHAPFGSGIALTQILGRSTPVTA